MPNAITLNTSALDQYGDVIQYTCIEGYRYVKGKHSKVCDKNEDWVGEDLVCKGRVHPFLSPCNMLSQCIMQVNMIYCFINSIHARVNQSTYMCFKKYCVVTGRGGQSLTDIMRYQTTDKMASSHSGVTLASIYLAMSQSFVMRRASGLERNQTVPVCVLQVIAQ